jgi:sulfite dehydrogenase
VAHATVGDLKTMGLEMLLVLQCSGNVGFRSAAPVDAGAAGCVVWSGAGALEVVQALGGVSPGMNYMTSTGGEKPPAGPRKASSSARRPLPPCRTRCWPVEMNGAPIPLAHRRPAAA